MNRVAFAKKVFFIIEKFMKAMCKSFRHNFLYFSKLLDCWYKVTYICEHRGQKDATIFKFRLLYNQKKILIASSMIMRFHQSVSELRSLKILNCWRHTLQATHPCHPYDHRKEIIFT